MSGKVLERQSEGGIAMFRKILVPLDGSKLAEKVLPFAAREAKAHGASLILLRVVHPFFLEEPVTEAEQVILQKGRERASRYLEEVRARLMRDEGIEAKIEVGEGEPAQVILDVARAKGCDLIAMTTHGYTGLERFIWGSVADKVAKASETPLLLIRSIPVATAAIPAVEAEAQVGV
jgi:nucleotide-binding universal stress UspA family protein